MNDMQIHGMPGPGGSLGQCALCGQTFIVSILKGDNVQSGVISGVQVFVHPECIEKYAKDGQIDRHALPDESPLKLEAIAASKEKESVHP